MTRQAYDLNTEGFGPGSNGPLVVAAELPEPDSEDAVDDLAATLRAEEGVAFVPDPVVNQAGSAAIVTVIPTTSPQDQATEDLLKRLREDVIPAEVQGSSHRPRRRHHRGLRRSERVHQGQDPGLSRRCPRALVPCSCCSRSTRR